jgi:RHS repeat-associated protein
VPNPASEPTQSYRDYYPFGMEMPGRSYEAGGYRFGFNGKEADPETVAAGSQYDYGFRIYNAAIGRFLSVDPLTTSYPWYTPYQFAGNMPIWAIDIDGLEQWVVVSYFRNGKYLGESILRIEESFRIPKRTGSAEKYTGVVYLNYNLGQQEEFDHSQVHPGNWSNKIRNSNTSFSFSDELYEREQAMLKGLEWVDPEFYKGLLKGDYYAKYTEPLPENIQFESNSYDLNAESIAELETLAKKMNTFLDSKYSIEAHTDNVGTDLENQNLSEARAKACFDYLTTELGIDPSRLAAIGHGETKPIATNETEEGRAQNRRVEFVEIERGY